jgi:hypothetical protein
MVPSDIDLPPVAVTEIASILAHGYLRHRASLRRRPHAAPDGNPAEAADAGSADASLAFPTTQSVHVTVVDAKRKTEKGEQR